MKNLDTIIEGYLHPIAPRMPREASLLIFLTKLSQITNFKRLTITDGLTQFPANIYSILFLPSGIGKDKTVNSIDSQLFQSFYKAFSERESMYKTKKELENKQYIEDKLNGSKAEQIRYLENNKPRNLYESISDGTPEGLSSQREAFSDAGFGGTFVQISEFADFIQKKDESREQFLSMLTDIYDMGNSSPKAIKGEKTSKRVLGVPNTILFYSSPSQFLEHEYSKEKFYRFLSRGLARRCFICFNPPIQKFKKTTFEEYNENLKILKEDIPVFRAMIDRFINGIEYNEIMTLEETALRRYFSEGQEFEQQSFDTQNEIKKAELGSRAWRTLKLSAIVEKFENPKSLVISEESYIKASEISQLFLSYTDLFEKRDDIDTVVQFFINNKENEITLTDLRRQNFVQKNQFSKWFNDIYNMLADELAFKGYKITKEKGSRNAIFFRVVKSIENIKPNNVLDFVHDSIL